MANYPSDWESWLPVVSEKLDALARSEAATRAKVDELYNAIYKNGLSAKVSVLDSWRRGMNGLLVALVSALIIGLGGSIWASVERAKTLELKYEQIEKKLDNLLYEKRGGY